MTGNGWIDVKKKPKKFNKFGDSIDCLIYDDATGATATAWYNHITEEWKLLHFSTHSNPINVTHWQPLPAPPNKK